MLHAYGIAIQLLYFVQGIKVSTVSSTTQQYIQVSDTRHAGIDLIDYTGVHTGIMQKAADSNLHSCNAMHAY